MKGKHLKGILLDIITLALCITAIFVGVFSVKNADLDISGEIGFEKHERVSYLGTNWKSVISNSTTGFGASSSNISRIDFVDSLADYNLSEFIQDDSTSTPKKVSIGANSENSTVATTDAPLDSWKPDITVYAKLTTDNTYEIVIYSPSTIYAPYNCGFRAYEKLTTINFNNFNTSKITSMRFMFLDSTKIQSLDLSSFDTSNVSDMVCMFTNCTNLSSLNLNNFNTVKVTDMGRMFESCSSLTSLDLSSFNTSKVTKMTSMFSYCKTLTSLNVSNFDISGVSDIGNMFYGCSSL